LEDELLKPPKSIWEEEENGMTFRKVTLFTIDIYVAMIIRSLCFKKMKWNTTGLPKDIKTQNQFDFKIDIT
jgi:hypothetical protein